MPLVGKATVNTNILNEFLTETIVKLSKTCAAKALNKIDINVGNVAGDVTIGGEIKQTAASELKCDQKSDLQSAIKSEMANIIKQSATSKDSSIVTGDAGLYSETTANNNTTNRSIMTTSLDDVMICVSAATNDFKVQFGSVGGNFTFNPTNFDQNASARVLDCVQKTTWSQKIENKVINDVEQTAANKGTLDSLFDGVARIVPSVITLIIVLASLSTVGYLIYAFINRNKKPAPGFLSGIFGGGGDAAAETAGEVAAETGEAIAETAGEVMAETGEVIAETAGEVMAETAGEVAASAGEAVQEVAQEVAASAGEAVAQGVGEAVQEAAQNVVQ
jgi:hypothetical protein